MKATREQKLERIFRISLEIWDVKDIDVLLEKILTEARRLANADAGSIYIREDDGLRFTTAQNDTLQQKLEPGRRLPFESKQIPINNQSIAGHVATTSEIINLPDVYHLPGGVPFSFDPRFDASSGYHTQSVLGVPLKDVRNEVLGVLQIINARDEVTGEVVRFESDDIPIFMHFANHAALALDRARMMRSAVLRMIKMSELHDPMETAPHANRVATYSMLIFEAWARRMAMPEKEIDRLKDILKVAAMLHDVGKIAIPDSILRKQGALSPEEIAIMRKHTTIGARLFDEGNSELDRVAATVALNHHERWDGSGYPGNPRMNCDPSEQNGITPGKKGHEIPIFGRIVAVADVYDVLLSRRSYKEPWSEDAAIGEIKERSGTDFDPGVVDAFLSALDSIHAVTRRLADKE